MYFEIQGAIEDVETIAIGHCIRELDRLKRQYGSRRRRKLKGTAVVKLANGNMHKTEVHWYEAHGIGKRKMKIKRLLD